MERTWRRLTGVRCGAREACSNVSARSPSRQRQHPAPRLIALTAQQGCRCCVLGGCVSFRPPRPPDTTLMGPPATWSGTSTRASPRSLLRTSAASSAPPRTRLAARNPPRGRDRQPLKRPLRPCPALLDRAERVLCARHHSCPAGVRQSSASPRSPRAFALSRSRARARSLSRCVPSTLSLSSRVPCAGSLCFSLRSLSEKGSARSKRREQERKIFASDPAAGIPWISHGEWARTWH